MRLISTRWHLSPNLHGYKWAVAQSYDMYAEMVEGKLDPSWRCEAPLSFNQFRQCLAMQLLTYTSTRAVYPGESTFRVSTQRSQTARRKSHEPGTGSGSHMALPPPTRGKRFNDEFHNAIASNGACAFCGARARNKCEVCNVILHDPRCYPCFANYHKPDYFGLCYSDCKTGEKRKSFVTPSKVQARENAQRLRQEEG